MKRTLLIIILGSMSAGSIFGQIDRLIQVSGIIHDVNNRPVAGVSVISLKLHRGISSEATGIYSITSEPGDTLLYRALGYRRYHTIIPPDFEGRHINFDITLQADTIEIEAVTILPWKSYSEFLKDITREHPVDSKIENMNDNLASIYVAIANQSGVAVTPEAGYRYAMQQNFNYVSTRNQGPVNNLLNPFAWAKFINGIKNGLLKNQKYDKAPKEAKVRKKIKKTSD